MQIHGERDALLEVGQAVLRVVSARVTLPVLGGVKIVAGPGSVTFASTDLEVFATVTGEFAVDKEGMVVVPGRLFGEILRTLAAGRVTISGEGGEVRIEGGRTEFSVRGYAVEDFPEVPEVASGSRCRADGGELARGLRQVVRAAGVDEARPILTGVLWAMEGENLRLVATDSYRLAIRELSIKEGQPETKAVIPGRALTEFGRHLSEREAAEVVLGESQASLSASSVRLVTRLIEGEFPNYRQLVPEGYSNVLSTSTESLAAAVERVGIVAQTNTPVRLHLGDEVQLTATEAGVAEASEVVEEASYSGEPIVVAFNPRFLKDGLEALEVEQAVIELGDASKPALIRGAEAEGFTYLLMPVRLPG